LYNQGYGYILLYVHIPRRTTPIILHFAAVVNNNFLSKIQITDQTPAGGAVDNGQWTMDNGQ